MSSRVRSSAIRREKGATKPPRLRPATDDIPLKDITITSPRQPLFYAENDPASKPAVA